MNFRLKIHGYYHMIPKNAENIGFYGFGSAANLLIQLAVFERKKCMHLPVGETWSGRKMQLGRVLNSPEIPRDDHQRS